MEHRVLVKSLREEDHGSTQIHSTLVEHYWGWQFGMGRESVEDLKRRERPPDFQTHFKIEGPIAASPNSSVRDFAQTTGIAPSTGFYVLTQVLHLEFRSWRRASTN
jgi:hypothetical protein